MATERLQASIQLRERSSAAAFLAAVREYVEQRPGRPWMLVRRRPFVLHHASRRAKGVAYRLARETAREVRLVVSGKGSRLGLAYAVTLLASERFAEHVAGVNLRLNPD